MNAIKNNSFAITSIAAGALVTCCSVVFYSNSSAADEKKPTTQKAALAVTVAQPTPTRLPIKLAANGSITAWQEAIIGSEVNGLRLQDVRVNVGDRVAKGQVLATFAVESVQAELAQSLASLMEAEANAQDAAGNAGKARTLQASGALSEQQINQYTTLEKTAQARLEVAKAALTVQQVRLKQTRLLAPDNGVISARTATVGSVVGTGAELFRMIRGGRLEWRAEVTSSELGRLSAGTPAVLVAANGATIKGTTRMIGPVVDPQTRAGLVYVDLPANGADNPFKAGMFARGEFELGATDGLTVPQRSVVVRDGFNYVFKLGDDNRVSQVKVQTSRLAGDRVEVVSGLNQQTRIVVDGAGFLNDGDVVRIGNASEKVEQKEPLRQAIKASSATK
jgi:RND family efflux transporter MFP subunit